MKLQHSTWPQVQRYFEEEDTVIIPVGSTENHGKHMPLGTDALVPEEIAEMVEARLHVLTAPVIPFGNCPYFEQFPGTINLGHKLLFDVLQAVADSLYRAGARRFIFLNGHGGNSAVIEEVGYGLSKKHALAAVMNWWTMVGDFNPKWLGGHGGGQETAAILAINSDWVDRRVYQDKDIADVSDEIQSLSLKMTSYKNVKVVIPREVGDICENGWYGPDALEDATPEWGEQMLTATADYIADFIREFKKAPLGRRLDKSS